MRYCCDYSKFLVLTEVLLVQEFFESLHREVTQCESGQCLEKIEGDQVSKATFTLLPMEGTCKYHTSY